MSELKWWDEYDWMMRGAKSLGTNTLIRPLGWFIDPGSPVTLCYSNLLIIIFLILYVLLSYNY